MKRPQAEQKSAASEITFVRSQDFRNYYVNNVKIVMTPNDFGLICGQIQPPEGGKETVVEEQLAVRLSPQSLKVLATSLLSALDGWERIFGKLPEPPAGVVNTKGMADTLSDLQDQVRKLATGANVSTD
jgi:uncharacterized protein DUF3467